MAPMSTKHAAYSDLWYDNIRLLKSLLCDFQNHCWCIFKIIIVNIPLQIVKYAINLSVETEGIQKVPK